MIPTPHATLSCLAAILVGNVAPGQSVLQVGPGGFAQIHAAIAAAHDGDEIRIAPGTYEPFDAVKSLRIEADVPGTVTAAATFTRVTSSLGGAGRELHVAGLTFAGLATTAAGLVTFEDCAFLGVSNGTALSQVGGMLTLVRCEVNTPGPGLRIGFGSYCSAVDSTFTSTGNVVILTPTAVAVQNSRLQMSGCTLTGGSVTQAGFLRFAGLGLEVGQDTTAWLVDCTVRGGDELTGAFPPAAGAHIPPLAVGRGVLFAHRTQFQGGNGPGSGQAPPIIGTVTAEPQLGISVLGGAFVLGSQRTVELRGAPGDVMVAMASFGLALPTPIPGLAQPATGFLGTSAVVLGLAIGDTAGRGTFGIAVPNAPTFRGVGVWVRGVDLTPLPWQASAIAGGLLR